jgi:hypothetical protein
MDCIGRVVGREGNHEKESASMTATEIEEGLCRTFGFDVADVHVQPGSGSLTVTVPSASPELWDWIKEFRTPILLINQQANQGA